METGIWERIAEDNAARSSKWAMECGAMQARAESAERKVARLEPQAARLREALDAIANTLDPLEDAVLALDRHGIEIRGLSEALAGLRAIYDDDTNA